MLWYTQKGWCEVDSMGFGVKSRALNKYSVIDEELLEKYLAAVNKSLIKTNVHLGYTCAYFENYMQENSKNEGPPLPNLNCP